MTQWILVLKDAVNVFAVMESVCAKFRRELARSARKRTGFNCVAMLSRHCVDINYCSCGVDIKTERPCQIAPVLLDFHCIATAQT